MFSCISMQRFVLGLGLLTSCGLADDTPSSESADDEAEDVLAAESLGTCPLPASERGYVKWNPGHYILFAGANEANRVDNFLDGYRNIGTVKGMLREYFWSDLEPTRGNYRWEKIDEDIAKLAAANKKLAITIKYKYQISDTESSLPDYVLAFPNETVGGLSVPSYFEQGTPNDGIYNHGQHANFGHPRTRYRFNALLRAFSERYDGNPNVVSLSFLETATGADISAAQNNLFLDGILAMERHAGCVFKHTPLFQNLNFPRGRLAQFADNLETYGVGLGGPDVFWDSMSDPGNALGYNKPNQPKGIYHYYPPMSAVVPIGQQVHSENFRYSTRELMLPPPGNPHNLSPSVSLAKIYDFSKLQLKPNYMFWQVGGSGDVYGNALKARLTSDGLPLRTACPPIYGGFCESQ